MSSKIIDRGRGPEIAGTRVTVYRIMDYVRENALPMRMASELDLTLEEVSAALEYIEQHRSEVEAAYDSILERLARQRAAQPPSNTTPEELKKRIELRHGELHAGPSRQ